MYGGTRREVMCAREAWARGKDEVKELLRERRRSCPSGGVGYWGTPALFREILEGYEGVEVEGGGVVGESARWKCWWGFFVEGKGVGEIQRGMVPGVSLRRVRALVGEVDRMYREWCESNVCVEGDFRWYVEWRLAHGGRWGGGWVCRGFGGRVLPEVRRLEMDSTGLRKRRVPRVWVPREEWV